MKTQKNPVTSFEIPVIDLHRAMAFYRAVLGYEFEEETVDNNEMAWFPLDENTPGISGALVRGESYAPSQSGTRIYFAVDDIDATLTRANTHGGKTLYPKTSIGEMGFVAEFEDSEGNRIALHKKLE